MTDPNHHLHGPRSTPALISYAIIGVWTLIVGATFALIVMRIQVADVMVGILGAILSTASGGVSAVAAFWLAGAMSAPRKDAAKPEDPKP